MLRVRSWIEWPARLCLIGVLWHAPASAVPVLGVGKVVSGNEFILGDGRTVHLEGIATPWDETLADQSRTMLDHILAGGEISLDHEATDRYGRTTAQIFVTRPDGAKILAQEEMLRSGMAFIYPPVGNEFGLDPLFKTEAEAREAKRGIWADNGYADVPAEKAAQKYGQFAFVTGNILKAERIKGKVYLNFGADWRTDFTIAIAAHDLKAFYNENLDPLDYEGMKVRVRGWVKHDFGPMITVSCPEQIEIIELNAARK